MRKFRAPVEKWQIWIAIVLAIATPLTTAAVTYGRDTNRLTNVEKSQDAIRAEQDDMKSDQKRIDETQDLRLKSLEGSSSRTDRNVVRIGQRLGIPMEMPK